MLLIKSAIFAHPSHYLKALGEILGPYFLSARIDLSKLSPQDLSTFITNLAARPKAEQDEVLALIEQDKKERHLQACRDDFLTFVRYIWPDFICGLHHEIMAREFQKIAEGAEKRLTISLPPRSGKSELTSYLFPAWFLGKYPNKKVLQISHKGDLAVGFGRKVRNLFSDPKFKEIFPGITLKTDNKAAGRWETSKGGSYYAAGVGAGLAGFGADLCLTANSPVLTERGYMRMEDLICNPSVKRVVAFNHETGKPELSNIIARGSRVSHELIDVLISGKKISCTPEHPFWVEGRGYVQAKNLRPGDKTCQLRFPALALVVALFSKKSHGK